MWCNWYYRNVFLTRFCRWLQRKLSAREKCKRVCFERREVQVANSSITRAEVEILKENLHCVVNVNLSFFSNSSEDSFKCQSMTSLRNRLVCHPVVLCQSKAISYLSPVHDVNCITRWELGRKFAMTHIVNKLFNNKNHRDINSSYNKMKIKPNSIIGDSLGLLWLFSLIKSIFFREILSVLFLVSTSSEVL